MEKQQRLFAHTTVITKHQEDKKTPQSLPTFSIYIDGAARGNPGPAGAGVFIIHHETPIVKKGIFLGEKTNNQAEYLALALALYFVNELCVEKEIDRARLLIFSDSELLIKQMRGSYRVKNEILILIRSFIDTLMSNYDVTFTHVLREKNKEADKLANLGIDKKNKIPPAFLQLSSDFGLSI